MEQIDLVIDSLYNKKILNSLQLQTKSFESVKWNKNTPTKLIRLSRM